MLNDLPHIESNKAGLLFLLAGSVVGASIGIGNFLATGSLEPVFGFAAGGGLIMMLCWIWILAGRYNRRSRRMRNRAIRRALGVRSPWGEQRTTAAGPFSDRLTHFLSHSIEADSPRKYSEPPTSNSSVTFWSIFDLPQDVTEPKPTWYLRRILFRIKEAVRGPQL